MKCIFSLCLFVLQTHLCVALNVHGQFISKTSPIPKFLNLTLVEKFNDIRFIDGTKVVAKTKVKEDGSFSISVSDLSPENMLYRISLNDDSLGISIQFGPENFILFWASNKSHITLPSISLSSSEPPAYDTSSTDICNRELVRITHLLSTSTSKDESSNGTNYITLQAKALMKDDLSVPASILALSYFYSEEDVFRDPVFYKYQIERLQKLDSEHPYVLQFKDFVRQNSRLKDIDDQEKNTSSLFYVVISCICIGALLLLFFWKQKKSSVPLEIADTDLKLVESLSIKERTIAKYIADGKTNKEIADMLSVELSTIKTHASNIFSKLQISSRKEVLKFRQLL